MPSLLLDFDPPLDDAPGFSGDTSDLVWFLSWAFATRYGASHELTLASVALRQKHGIDLTPLLTFADREVDEPADAEELERVWQDAATLADCCDAVVAAFATSEDERLVTVRAEYPALAGQLGELASNARWATERGARLRITYSLGR
jgi:hypothetical protein